eukprot:scaffold1107_cov162-Cylindrotheca_fusiformis.AAC.2
MGLTGHLPRLYCDEAPVRRDNFREKSNLEEEANAVKFVDVRRGAIGMGKDSIHEARNCRTEVSHVKGRWGRGMVGWKISYIPGNARLQLSPFNADVQEATLGGISAEVSQ